MIGREEAFKILSELITDQLVVTGIASQTTFWYQAKHRPENLYLRGPMGLAPAIGLGVAMAHPQRRVVAIEGDGSMLMGLTSLTAVAHLQPKNYTIICVDNGLYEGGGQGKTIGAGKIDFVKTVQGMGIAMAESVTDPGEFKNRAAEYLNADRCGFLHTVIAPRKEKLQAPMLKPYEMKHQFLSALQS